MPGIQLAAPATADEVLAGWRKDAHGPRDRVAERPATLRRLTDVSGSAVCSRQRTPR